jgi:hypothetical protein
MESILWNIFSVVMVILLYTWKKYYMDKHTIYFDIERPWTLKFNQVYTQLFSDYVIRCLILF